jgi:hypothetical protein
MYARKPRKSYMGSSWPGFILKIVGIIVDSVDKFLVILCRD